MASNVMIHNDQVVDTPLESDQASQLKDMVTTLIERRMGRMMQGGEDHGGVQMPNCSIEYAGSISTQFSNSVATCLSNFWIIDSGASTHMCGNLALFTSHSILNAHVPIQLPDGSIKHVNIVETVKITSTLLLLDCIYVPAFSFNLLSASKLAQSFSM
ncbi:hypothetical protein LIER_18897 [Lithospermum erythrorhizon]|uniref:Retrovirus-related Pol polyprotein from transposon TNT 1-94-like beta-barrel domain-containing protein n=1 Tax=Lithospermum erythrorhizon TaxID=34254 RepID=A0AAV3QK47_LITER